jgi:hypothetical protein
MEDRRAILLFLFLYVSLSVSAVVPENITEDDYMKAYFSVYKSYISGNDASKGELIDVIDYYLTTDDLADNLYYVGSNSNKMIGSILADAGTVFDCGPCNMSSLGQRCCIYKIGSVPLAYECVGTEVIGPTGYDWKNLWQCSYGCCRNKCCRSENGTTTSIVTTTIASTTTLYPPTTTTTTLAATTTTSSINPTTTLNGFGEICVDCCAPGQTECKMQCKNGISQSSGPQITECVFDGSTVTLKRGSSISQTLSCPNGKCTGTQPSTTAPVTTTTTTSSTTVIVSSSTTVNSTTTSTTTQGSSTTSSTTVASTTTSSSSTTTTTTVEPRITILYIPVDWTGTSTAFNSIVDNQITFLLDNIPLKACPDKVRSIRINSSCTVNVPADWDTCYADANRILTAISYCAQATGQRYDYVIGLSSVNLCAGRGFTSFTFPVIYLAGDEPRKTTHELGHQWGLGDEYYDTCRCFSVEFPQCTHNCLDISLGGGDPTQGYTSSYCAQGTLCPDRIGVSTCFGNKNPINTRCIMGTDYVGNDRDFCTHCSNYLSTLNLLKC